MEAEALRDCSGLYRGETPIMGSVLSFQPRTAVLRTKRIAAEAAASVIIFPGVRYERETASLPAVETAAASRPDNRQEQQPQPRR